MKIRNQKSEIRNQKPENAAFGGISGFLVSGFWFLVSSAFCPLISDF
jgi:hypothetical protein